MGTRTVIQPVVRRLAAPSGNPADVPGALKVSSEPGDSMRRLKWIAILGGKRAAVHDGLMVAGAANRSAS